MNTVKGISVMLMLVSVMLVINSTSLFLARPARFRTGWVRHTTTTDRGESRTLHPAGADCPVCRAEVPR